MSAKLKYLELLDRNIQQSAIINSCVNIADGVSVKESNLNGRAEYYLIDIMIDSTVAENFIILLPAKIENIFKGVIEGTFKDVSRCKMPGFVDLNLIKKIKVRNLKFWLSEEFENSLYKIYTFAEYIDVKNNFMKQYDFEGFLPFDVNSSVNKTIKKEFFIAEPVDGAEVKDKLKAAEVENIELKKRLETVKSALNS